MNTFFFLMSRRLINSLKASRKKLVLVIFMILAIGLVLVSGIMGQKENTDYRDLSELGAIIFAVYMLISVITMNNGLGNGAAFFSMADVNLLFTAPKSNKKILLYGLVQQLGTACITALVLVYQYGWLANTYCISILDMLVIILGYILCIFCSQLVAMIIYSYTTGNDKRKSRIKTVLYGVPLVCAAWVISSVFTGGDRLQSAVAAVNAIFMDALPIVGWLRAAVVGLLNGQWLSVVLGFGGTALLIAGLVLLILKTDADYYEDVLMAAEVSQSAINARKEGQVAEDMPQNIKVGNQGLRKGWGASAFFYKHMLENRRSRMFLVDKMTLIWVVMSIVFALIARELGFVFIFSFTLYFMMIASFTGRWIKELTKPYVYMLPVSSFKKLVMICGETVLKSIVETVLILVPIGIIFHLPPLEIAAGIFTRVCFAFLLISATILSERLFGSLPGKVLQFFLYFLCVIVLLTPGIILAVVLSILLGTAAGIFLLGCWMLVSALIIAFLCRNILVYAELNNN